MGKGCKQSTISTEPSMCHTYHCLITALTHTMFCRPVNESFPDEKFGLLSHRKYLLSYTMWSPGSRASCDGTTGNRTNYNVSCFCFQWWRVRRVMLVDSSLRCTILFLSNTLWKLNIKTLCVLVWYKHRCALVRCSGLEEGGWVFHFVRLRIIHLAVEIWEEVLLERAWFSSGYCLEHYSF